ncbi:LAMI_0C02630g1_1 [Lachancea mirantina]|uniref:LAMI_0C02630g1_1 n=1 Tax=Lachancea mirantina TaxID=1230905 RepID=A0A1G4J182_9SACH|nr:LAMI_0C02630g1_1 [Lachancea mirantina]
MTTASTDYQDLKIKLNRPTFSTRGPLFFWEKSPERVNFRLLSICPWNPDNSSLKTVTKEHCCGVGSKDKMSNGNNKNAKSIGEILNKEPDFVKNSPLDRFFEDFKCKFVNRITYNGDVPVYEEVGCTNYLEFGKLCLKYLETLASVASSGAADRLNHKDASQLIPISLNDMKYFDLLLNLIVVHCFTANLPANVGIPIDQRRFDALGKTDHKFDIPAGHTADLEMLALSCDTVYGILVSSSIQENIVSKLMLKGTGFTDVVTAAIALQCLGSQSERYTEMIDILENLVETYQLFSLYTLLLNTSSEPRFRQVLLSRLTVLSMVRKDGISSLVDFVVGIREEEEIDMAKYDRVAHILVSKPKSIKNVAYFSAIFAQIYDCLVDFNKPVLTSCINNAITIFYLKNKRIPLDFLFKRIFRVLYNTRNKAFSSKELNDTINVLISLSKNTSFDLLSEIISPTHGSFFQALWGYALFLRKHQRLQPGPQSNGTEAKPYYMVILSLIKSYALVSEENRALNCIMDHLVAFEHDEWGYAIDFETQLPYMYSKNKEVTNLKPLTKDDRIMKLQEMFSDIDLGIEMFMQLTRLFNDHRLTKKVFLCTTERWVRGNQLARQSHTDEDDIQSNLTALIDLKILEKMNEVFKADILKDPKDLLALIDELLDLKPEEVSTFSSPGEDSDDEENSDDEDGYVASDDESSRVFHRNVPSASVTLFELLGAVLHSTPKMELLRCQGQLKSISQKLSQMEDRSHTQHLMDQINSLLQDSTGNSIPFEDLDRFDADTELLQKANSYLNDSIAPVRAQGLYLLRSLIYKKSGLLDAKSVLDLHMRQLQDPDPFIYLNAIKGLTLLCEMCPEISESYLTTFYRNCSGEASLEDILKVGEVLTHRVTTLGELFGGQFGHQLVSACLEKVRQHGQTDDRLRMSAMSLLGACVRNNVLAVRRHINDMLGCCFGILRLEKANQTKTQASEIMRRSAVHLIHDLVVSSDLSILARPYDVTTLLTLLKNVAQQDNDYLVCEDAASVIKLLEAERVAEVSRTFTVSSKDMSIVNQLRL